MAVRQELSGGVTSFVVSGVFSPVNASQEEEVGRIIEDEMEQASSAAGSLLLCHFCSELHEASAFLTPLSHLLCSLPCWHSVTLCKQSS